jgi:tRNA threonylcarbamoyladenosine biosynthesis protein TsaB
VIALAIDTSTDRLGVALRSANGALVERYLDGARQHAAQLLPMLKSVLTESGLELSAVQALALADGPGSFTGLRVGASVVKALARAHPSLAVWTASNLMVRAAGASPVRPARVLVVTSALRGELYAGVYRCELPAGVETVLAPGLATPESLHAQAPDLIVADASEGMADRLAAQFSVPLIRGRASLPSPATLLGLIEVPGGAVRLTDLDDWEPTYGRPAEAQARWEAAHGPILADSTRRGG